MEKCRKNVIVSDLTWEIGNWFSSSCYLVFNLIAVIILAEI